MKLKVPLEICGQGAVTPCGIGVDSLLNDQPCRAKILPRLSSALRTQDSALSTQPDGWPVFSVDLNDPKLTRWQNEPRLRRAPRIALFMVEAARQALDGTGWGKELIDERSVAAGDSGIERRASNVEHPFTLGIVAAFFTGSIAFSRRFYQENIEQGQRFASPALFPETVFNSPTSHVAAVLGAGGPCYSVVGDDSAWVNALAVAACWLNLNVVERVLVLGAEELDPIVVEACARARWIRKGGRFIPSEGAGALLLKQSNDGTGMGNANIMEIAEGFTYRSPKRAQQAASECVTPFNDVQNVYRSANNNWFARIEEDLHVQKKFKSPPRMPYRGEAFVASAAWNTIRARSFLARGWSPLLQPVWGLHEQCSALLLGTQNTESPNADR